MNTEITQFPLAPVATVMAAVITAVVSFVTLTLNKEQKISEFRQAWINGLRDELATLFSTARALCRTMQEARSPQKDDDDVKGFRFSNQKVGEMRLQTADSLYKIKLRLNKEEAEHAELERLLMSAIKIQNNLNQQKAKDYDPALKAIDTAADYARCVLKNEWERVKIGERSFRNAKKGMIVLVVVVSAIVFWITQSNKGITQSNKERSNQSVDTTPASAPR